jgi:hypothetical protein
MTTESMFVSASCKGEHCSICGQPATRKVAEEFCHDDPTREYRHEMTAYVCADHFEMIMNRGACKAGAHMPAIYVAVAVNPDGEGIIAGAKQLPDGNMMSFPFVTSSLKTLERIKEDSKGLCPDIGKVIRIVEFRRAQVLVSYAPPVQESVQPIAEQHASDGDFDEHDDGDATEIGIPSC